MTLSSVAGGDGLEVAPESPLPWEAGIPAGPAASLKRLRRSRVVSGSVEPPKDSLRMSAWSTVTAQSRPWRIVELNDPPSPKTFIPISDAPGATPRTVIVQPGGSGCAGLT